MVINFSNIGTSGGGGEYTLPTATENRLGGVKIGEGINVAADGTISAEGGSGDNTKLAPLTELPAGEEIGEVRALSKMATVEHKYWEMGGAMSILTETAYTLNFVSSTAQIYNENDAWYFSYNDTTYTITDLDNAYVEIGGPSDLWIRAFNDKYDGLVFNFRVPQDEWVNIDPYAEWQFEGQEWSWSEEVEVAGGVYQLNHIAEGWVPASGKVIGKFRMEYTDDFNVTFDSSYDNDGYHPWVNISNDGTNLQVSGGYNWFRDNNEYFSSKWGNYGAAEDALHQHIYLEEMDGVTYVVYEDENNKYGAEDIDNVEKFDGDVWNEIGGIAELPIASETKLGAIKVGDNLYMDGDRLCANGGGGSGSSLEPVDELPESASNGQLFNYNGRIVKYNEDEGNWGQWLWDEKINTYTDKTKNSIVLHYVVIPEELNGETLISISYFNYNDGNRRKNFVLNLVENKIDVYDYETSEYIQSISKGDIDISIYINGSYNTVYVSWEEGKISFRRGFTYAEVREILSTEISSPHYELLNGDNLSTNIEANYETMKFPLWDNNGNIIGSWDAASTQNIYYNTTGYTNVVTVLKASSGNFPQRMWIPTQGGNQGQVLTSTGGNEPQWATLIKSVRITEEEYEALATKDPNTLYLIVEE